MINDPYVSCKDHSFVNDPGYESVYNETFSIIKCFCCNYSGMIVIYCPTTMHLASQHCIILLQAKQVEQGDLLNEVKNDVAKLVVKQLTQTSLLSNIKKRQTSLHFKLSKMSKRLPTTEKKLSLQQSRLSKIQVRIKPNNPRCSCLS